jgi:mannan endo-1,4-beta-mannosidase
MIKPVITVISLLCMVFACKSVPSPDPAGELLQIIRKSVQQGLIMFGHQDDTAYGTNWHFEKGRSDVYEVAGDYPAVCGWDLGRIELNDSLNIDKIPFRLIRSLIIEQHERGGINTISWHPRNPENDQDTWTVGGRVVASILPGGLNHEKFTGWLDHAADFLLSLRDGKGQLIPVIFRPLHEHTGSWFWWGKEWCTSEEYKSLWKFIHQYMSAKGLNNLVWAYSPGSEGDAAEYIERFPGREYADMLGLDTYQFNNAEGADEYMKLLRRKLTEITELGQKLDMPVALTETGLEGIVMPDWWTNVLWTTIRDFPLSYVLVWRNAWDREGHFYTPYPGHISAKNFIEFYQLPQTAFVKEVERLR